jgi:hypothetical protein
MPVSRYRSVADMPRPEPATSSELAVRIRVLWNRAFLLSRPSFPRGVARFRSVEEANAARERATLERMQARGGARRRS